MPHHIALDSSCISSVTYGANILDVAFVHGATYRYFDVPALVFHSLLDAASKGAFLNRVIKPRFRFERLP